MLWRTNERPGTNHVTSGPMTGLIKSETNYPYSLLFSSKYIVLKLCFLNAVSVVVSIGGVFFVPSAKRSPLDLPGVTVKLAEWVQ